MSHLTTHVLDAATGDPAAGIGVELRDEHGHRVATGTTDADGRAAVGPQALPAGRYDLVFATGAYFAERAVRAFFPVVTVTFEVEVGADGTSRHYHVPLLLSPFAYSTYRGS